MFLTTGIFMVSDAKKVGEAFRTKREELNLSLKEVESATSIRTNYLEAIEEGCLEKFLSTVYMYGFMRQYAVFLGIDIEIMAREHPEMFKLPHAPHEFDFGIGTLEKRSGTGSSIRSLPNLLWAGGMVVVLMVAWWFAKLLGVV